ncbi:acryloyl-CoA reductase [Arsenicitalea aurantiaca]|uniref:Acryloyl-CoA reductase n=1 Tax=Arsenicitalea aurantiaca TaxID=1783274 RepID=A0A433XLK5_9HYPH|nr:acryloyl-CoA reductase [Arsenicitalea aurantiaca]RUT34941.1 acryloyl-CoA reductase [Arsenicitalea aurantiaca]
MVFRALVTDRDEEGLTRSTVQWVPDEKMPAGDVLVAIEWSGLNYKDALCLAGQGRLVREYPHIAGIDFAGRVVDSSDDRYRPGQAVALTGWHVGERRWGGFATRARVAGDWLVPLPKRLAPREAMVLGTAGFSAMLAINRLKDAGITMHSGDVVVTGAGGGVGSMAVMLLARLGYNVVAVSGRPELYDEIKRLGAHRIIGREEMLVESGKPLDSSQWSAAIDSVGGPLLGQVLKKIKPGGVVAAVGNAGGMDWQGSVAPFILRGLSLFGINSVDQPYDVRVEAWERLASLYLPTVYGPLVREAVLGELEDLAALTLSGGVGGRVVVNPRDDTR